MVGISKERAGEEFANWKAKRKEEIRPELYRAIGRYLTELVIPGLDVDVKERKVSMSSEWYVKGSKKQEQFYQIIDGLSANEISRMIGVGQGIARDLVDEVLKGEIK